MHVLAFVLVMNVCEPVRVCLPGKCPYRFYCQVVIGVVKIECTVYLLFLPSGPLHFLNTEHNLQQTAVLHVSMLSVS